jgi:anti-anti-sigma factor
MVEYMNIIAEIIDDYLVLTPDGRFDGYGSGLIEQVFNKKIKEQIKFVIFDLKNVPYISSAGIRTLLIIQKSMNVRSGNLILCNILPFPQSVLKMAGMEKIFKISPDLNQAFVICKNLMPDFHNSLKRYSAEYRINEGVLKISSISNNEAHLQVTGSLTRILHSSVRPEDVKLIRFTDCEYSIGCGALAEDKERARQLLGEMITIHGSIIWLPTDGNNTPDYYIPIRDTGEVRIYSAFNAALQGPFHDFFTFNSDSSEGVPISSIYRIIFDHARKNREIFSGIIAITLIGQPCEVRSSAILHPPVPEYAPPGGGSIMDPGNIKNWIEVKEDLRNEGEILVSFGIGVDLKSDLSKFDSDDLSALYYIHPSNRGSQEMFLHTHGVIFRDVYFDQESDINTCIGEILKSGEFLDMRHLMDDTKLKNISGAVSYISKIVCDSTH